MFPAYVPSKGRVGLCLTCEQLDAANIPYTLIVPENEVRAYAECYRGKILGLQKDGMRVGTVRNLILDQARTNGDQWIWMLDDDIAQLRIIKDGRVTTQPIAALQDLEPTIQRLPPVAQAGMTGSLPCPSRTHLSWNGPCCVAVAFNMERMKHFSYNETLFFAEDAEITLQLLTCGEQNVRFLHYSYVNKSFGKTGKEYPGGLENAYKTQSVEKSLQKVAHLYPGITKVRPNRNGAFMLVTNWKRLGRHS